MTYASLSGFAFTGELNLLSVGADGAVGSSTDHAVVAATLKSLYLLLAAGAL